MQSPQAALAFLPPEPLPPAVAALAGGLGARLIQARAGFDLRVRISPPAVRPVRFMRVAEPGGLSEAGFQGLATHVLPAAQRGPDHPALQLSLNLHLVTDRPCTLSLLPPFLAESFRGWPGTLTCGRFPLTHWPRALNAVLEWQDRDRDWVIRRGDPLAYLLPEFDDPALLPELFEAADTPALARHVRMVDNVSSFGRNVGPMFAEAARRRPPRLLARRDTGAPPWDGA
ncbi:hypothetical protein LNKW23_05440 [Paralimibaculum aggregatum]|uniref:Uncharacterized protein n=2 Tax=Paralimibaculum aggregatum TaxID=3036245 RepID=A0ABQ6LD98_9RHOB|nr:hypothetical protein LNKW23_05440 [Limibaculum sp. NKW23]